MQTIELKPFKIYSASAGSGKTYQLVQEYLKLVLGNSKGYKPYHFGKLLAMTFTNKAALEMKERVIKALDELAHENSPSLLSTTIISTGLPPNIIQERSEKILSEILHNYENFNLLTIDKFSLRLIRAFSKDLDLQDDFEVILDQKLLLEQVIDNLISKIKDDKNDTFTQLALTYAKSKAEDGNKWDFRKDLIDFSKILTEERSKEKVDELLSKNFLKEEYYTLSEEITTLNEEHHQICKKIYEYFSSLGTNENDYPSKSTGIYSHLSKLLNRNLDNRKPPSKKILETISGENVKKEHNVDPALIQMMQDLYTWENEHYSIYYSKRKQKANFYNIALLQHIAKELETFKTQQNLIGIYEFNQKIADLLQKENAPYIYERLGTKYEHYLLDEFQDTSRLQWLNLIPLIHDAVGNNHENLIVGDPKQAIYRWRNGSVEQFVELPGIYNPENDKRLEGISTFLKKMGNKISLENNYRSKKEIVLFNNELFSQILGICNADIGRYYTDVKQVPKGGDGGYVEIQKKELKSTEDICAQEEKFLLEKVQECIDAKFVPGDICVLIRNKIEGKRYAKALINANYKVVNSDSLLLASDASVRFCLDYLKLRKNQSNNSLQIKFATSYFRLQDKNPINELKNYWINGTVGKFNFKHFVETNFETFNSLFFTFENLYDLGKQFLLLSNLSELDNLYLHHLMELFHDFDLKFGPDIRNFTEEWESTYKEKATVQMAENDQAIRIMTIHKAKGLEFPIVILPNLSWKLKMDKGSFFVETDEQELIYTKLSKNDVPDYMKRRYDEEYLLRLLDELNVFYVAFTRPVERLYALLNTKLPKESDYFSQLNYLLANAVKLWHPNNIANNEERIIAGKKHLKTETHKSNATTLFTPKNFGDFLWFPKLTLQDGEALEKEKLNEAQQIGNQLHLVFAQIGKGDSITTIVKNLRTSAQIDSEYAANILTIAQKVEAKLKEQDFYQNATKILSEQDILCNEKITKRPDKIFISPDNKATIVDFKTGKMETRYTKQIKDYIAILQKMGFDEVKGYLLYTESMELEACT